MPKVSVVIAAHNRPNYLKEALNSLRQQTASPDDFEVVVVKDYELDLSKIDTGKINVSIIDTKSTELVTKHIIGIKASKGDFVALMDDDDLFAAIKIERILGLSQYMSRRTLYINGKEFFTSSLTNFSRLSKANSASFEVFERVRFNTWGLIKQVPWYNLSSMTIGKDPALEGIEIIKGFTREIDPLWYIIALDRADKIVYDASHLTFYRRHSGGVSRSGNKDKTCRYAAQAVESYDKMLKIFRSVITVETANAIQAEWYVKARSLGCSVNQSTFGNAFLAFFRSFRFHSIKNITKLFLLLFLSSISVRLSSRLYPKFFL